jgi:signal transduction histidine kinase
MTAEPLAAAIAWIALGATFLGTLLLLLFNPRSSGIRWYALFWVSIMVWLGAQGWVFATGVPQPAWRIVSVATHLAPGLFLAFALVEGMRKPLIYPLGAVGLALLTLPVRIASWDREFAEPLLMTWEIGVWTLATVIMVRGSYTEVFNARTRRLLGGVVVGGMVLVLPIGVLGSIITHGQTSVYVLPLLMVWIHVLTFVGVTHLRFYNIEVRAARTGELAAAAAEAERLAVLGELTASLAHEIRNPLTGVRSLAQRMAEDEVDDRRRRRYASVILEEVGRVERLVVNLLGLARRSPRHASGEARTPLATLFDDLLLLVGSRADKAGIRLIADAQAVIAPAPREPLAQVLLNLLLNAISHSPSGAAVELHAREHANGVEILVRDGGPGIEPAQRERIWEPFFSGAGGTGLGLAVVRRVTREHGWNADVDDAPGGGAEFLIHIPHTPDLENAPMEAALSGTDIDRTDVPARLASP